MFILVLTSGFLIAIGIQLFITLRDFRNTLRRVNGILDSVESASNQLESGLTKFAAFFDGFKSLLKTLEIINLLTPLQDYLKRKHQPTQPAISNSSAIRSKGIHALIDRMKDASQKRQERKFISK